MNARQIDLRPKGTWLSRLDRGRALLTEVDRNYDGSGARNHE